MSGVKRIISFQKFFDVKRQPKLMIFNGCTLSPQAIKNDKYNSKHLELNRIDLRSHLHHLHPNIFHRKIAIFQYPMLQFPKIQFATPTLEISNLSDHICLRLLDKNRSVALGLNSPTLLHPFSPPSPRHKKKHSFASYS